MNQIKKKEFNAQNCFGKNVVTKKLLPSIHSYLKCALVGRLIKISGLKNLQNL